MKSHPRFWIVLGGRTFKNKKELAEEARKLLRQANADEFLTGSNEDLARGLLARHPSRERKLTGCDIEQVRFMVRMVATAYGPSRCLFVVRPDGSMIDFSYRVALGLSPSLPIGIPTEKITEACRRAVDDICFAYKLARFNGADSIPCDQTGEPVHFSDAHVDHTGAWPFAAIVEAFLDEYGARELADHGLYRSFADPADIERFREFHNTRAILRIVHRDVNIGARR